MAHRLRSARRRVPRWAAALLLTLSFPWAPPRAGASLWPADAMPGRNEPDRCLARVLSFDRVVLERAADAEPRDLLDQLGIGTRREPPVSLAGSGAILETRAPMPARPDGCNPAAARASAPAAQLELSAGFGAIDFMPPSVPERLPTAVPLPFEVPTQRFQVADGLGRTPRPALPSVDAGPPDRDRDGARDAEESALRSSDWEHFEPLSTSLSNGVSLLSLRGYDRDPATGFGMEYSVRRGWVLRAGAQLYRSDLPDSIRTFQGVDERTRLGLGLSYALGPRLELDLAYLYALTAREVSAPAELPFEPESRSAASERMVGVTLRWRF